MRVFLSLTLLWGLASCAPQPAPRGDELGATTAPEHALAPQEPDVCPERDRLSTPLPGISADHLRLDYWLERQAERYDLDAPLLSAAEVAAMNLNRDRSPDPAMQRFDFSRSPEPGAIAGELQERIAFMRRQVESGAYLTAQGERLSPEKIAALQVEPELVLAPSLHLAEGLVEIRCAPLVEPLYTAALDRRFDRNRCVTLHRGEPLMVLHRGASLWLVRSAHTIGWMEPDAPISAALAQLPASPAPRVLTRRAVLERAFAELGRPYGWGGAGGGLDCSGFLFEIFQSFGIELPRFSGLQAQSGSFSIDLTGLESESARWGIIDAAADRGIVLLHFPGHIMLYLGRDEGGRPMVLHAFAEVVQPCDEPGRAGNRETLFEIDEVTVSDLELGRGASRTAFIERLNRVTVIGEPPGVGLAGVATRREPLPLSAEDLAQCSTQEGHLLVTTPGRPNSRQPLRAILTASADMGSVEAVFVAPDGSWHRPQLRRLDGPPDTLIAQVDAPASGEWTIAFGEQGRLIGCVREQVRRSPPAAGSGSGAVWSNRHAWDENWENLYAAFVESLFDYPVDDDVSWRSLHELTQDPNRNLFFDHGGPGQDETLILGPDCADLPYMLRAYFAWRMELPFGFRSCNRGRAGRPPECSNLQTNLTSRAESADLGAFQRYAQRDVRSGVHSASGRTAPEDNETDYYPVPLTREALRPGTMFADPYGHLLIIARWVPQGLDAPGILIGAEAQPDGTVSRRRFWRGSFLFSPDTQDAGAGFKAFRPIVVARDGTARSLSNRELAADPRFAPYSLQQYQGSTDDFYAAMESLINTRAIDAAATLIALVDALEESVSHRVISVDNGERYMRARRFPTIEMPSGHAIFETSGAWEDFSTPSRDMRLLISIDIVRFFPDQVRRAPHRYGVDSAPAAVDVAVRELQVLLAAELERRRFEYTRSDGSSWSLSLAELLERLPMLEMAYNPNDCAETRWAAPRGSDEASTCRRHAPEAQRSRMASYREWFASRTRPPR